MHHTPIAAHDYAARLESPDRDGWQRPAELVRSVGVTTGMRVADVGTGSGYLLTHLATAVGPTGRVVGEDIREDLIAFARRRVTEQHLTQVELRIGTATDPRLEAGAFDRIFVIDTFHHFVNVAAILEQLRAALAVGGQLVIVDFKEGNLPVGPAPGHKIPRAQIVRACTGAGFTLVSEPSILEYQHVLVFSTQSDPTAATGVAHLRAVTRPHFYLAGSDPKPLPRGLPARSPDGTTEVRVHENSDPLSDLSTISVDFVDVATGAVRETVVLVTDADDRILEQWRTDAQLRNTVRRIRANVERLNQRIASFVPVTAPN